MAQTSQTTAVEKADELGERDTRTDETENCRCRHRSATKTMAAMRMATMMGKKERQSAE